MSAAVSVGSAISADPSAGLDSTRTSLIVEGALTLTGNYGGASSNGDTLDFSGVVSSDYAPKWVTIYQEPTAGNAPTIYSFIYARGTTIANGLLIVTAATLVQITQGAAYPAALLAATANVRFRAGFTRT